VKDFKSLPRLPLFEEFLNQSQVPTEFNLFQYYGKEVCIGKDQNNPPWGLRLDFIGPEQIKGKTDADKLLQVSPPPGKYLIKGNNNEYVQLMDFEDRAEGEIRKCYLIPTQQFEEIKSEILTGYSYT
jgi:hypothetical protein